MHHSPKQGVTKRRSLTLIEEAETFLFLYISSPAVRKAHLTRGRPGGSSTARVERALVHRARSTSKGRSTLQFLSSFHIPAEGGGWLWCSSLRTSREHRFTVRPLGAGGASSRRTITTSSSPLSTPLPPSPCAAPRPSLAPVPSRLRGAAAERLQQKPSYVPPLS